MDLTFAQLWVTYIAQAVETMGDALALFIQTPTVYFTALAFAGACVGVARKLIPMRRR